MKNQKSVNKVIGIITSPYETGKGIGLKPDVLLPIILLILVPFLYYLILWDKLEPGLMTAQEEALKNAGVEMTREYYDQMMTITRYISLASGVFTVILGFFSALFYFICGKIAKSKAGYKVFLSSVYYVGIIGLLSMILNGILVSIGLSDGVTAMTSMAFALPESSIGTFTHSILSTIEVFNIWSLVVMYFLLIGAAKMSKKAAGFSVLFYYMITVFFLFMSNLISQING